ncbi:LAMI_0A05226g1_1 [Lachancea mirantina]|uniref:LAMI_0A05226g1_1 n=1 Tax=Lachancea mirantina TaxID=1230905 RepID=A0A1G4IPM3_9SACH|nr:LAMI_0A05226g1_1 [Lachancea mirantina]
MSKGIKFSTERYSNVSSSDKVQEASKNALQQAGVFMSILIDAHCHIATKTAGTSDRDRAFIPQDDDTPVARCVMSNNQFEWTRLEKGDLPKHTQLAFGVHPWYCHLFTLQENVDPREHYATVLECNDQQSLDAIIQKLPTPAFLPQYISDRFDRRRVRCIGEVGLDKLFRLPENGFYSQDCPARLGNVRVKMTHQIAVFRAMCDLAAREQLPVSLHAVKCHGIIFEQCRQLLLPASNVNVCLHSYTGSIATLRDFWLPKFGPQRLFVSTSQYINFKVDKDDQLGTKLLETVPLECLLTETDFAVDTTSMASQVENLRLVLTKIREHYEFKDDYAVQDVICRNFSTFLGLSNI